MQKVKYKTLENKRIENRWENKNLCKVEVTGHYQNSRE
jgi:hypothetical protein